MAEFDSAIPAGGSGKLTAKVVTHAGQRGRSSKSVTVYTDEQGVSPLRLQLTFEAMPAVLTEPPMRTSVETVVGDSATRDVVLRRADGKPIEIHDPVSDAPDLVLAAVAPRPAGADRSAATLALKVLPQNKPVTRLVTITTASDVPSAPTVRYQVSVRVRPQLEVVPGQVRLLTGLPGRELRQSEVRMVDHTGRAFRVLDVKSSRPDLFTAEARTPSVAAAEHVLTVRLAGGVGRDAPPGVLRGTIEVRTDEPDHPRVIVAVYVGRSARAVTVAPAAGRPVARPYALPVPLPAPTPAPAPTARGGAD